MNDVFVHEHALVHGLTEQQVLHAWRNAVAVARRACSNGEVDFVAIGFDQHGGRLRLWAAKSRSECSFFTRIRRRRLVLIKSSV